MSGNGKVFISHAHEDNDRCAPLLAALDAWGVDYWFDTQRLDAGQDLSERIQHAIAERDIFIKICTPAGQTSFSVKQETGAFRALQAKDHKDGHPGRRMLIPLLLEPGYTLEPMEMASVYIDTTGKAQRAWLDELRRAIGIEVNVKESERQILFVDAHGTGDYPRISDAIAAARPWCRILIKPGTYKEALIIDKPLEIIGLGIAKNVVIEAIGRNTLSFRASYGRIENLSLRQLGRGDGYGVEVERGWIKLIACDVSSETLACLAVHTGGYSHLAYCRIHGSPQSGMFFHDHGHGLVEDCDIYGTGYAAVQVKTGSDVAFHRNRIYDGGSHGIYIYETAHALLEDNDIFGNAKNGVQIRSGGRGTLRRDNRIHDNRESGVFVFESGWGEIDGNQIFANAYSGVSVRAKSQITLRHNVIARNGSWAIRVQDESAGTIQNNQLSRNGKGIYDIDDTSRPHLSIED